MDNDLYVLMLDGIGNRYGKRPSEILGVFDELAAFYFDYAILFKAELLQKGKLKSPQQKKKEFDAQFDSFKFAVEKAKMIKQGRR